MSSCIFAHWRRSLFQKNLSLNKKVSADIDDYFYKELGENKLGGAVVLLSKGDTIFHFKSYGWSDKEKNITMTDSSVFFIASMTKMFVAVSVLILEEEGRLKLDDPVSKYIPEVKEMKVGIEYTDSITYEPQLRLVSMNKEMTIRHLLSHTSGFMSANFNNGLIAQQYKLAAMWKYNSLKQMVMEHIKIPLASQPGEEWKYDFSYNVLAYLVETLSGKTLEEFFREKIFIPLGMKNTGYNVTRNNRPRVVQLFYLENNKLIQREPNTEEKVILFQGASGLWSTTEDYFRFCLMLQNKGEFAGKKILSTASAEKLFSDIEIGKDGNLLSWLPGYGFGLGFAIRADNSKCNFLGSEGELCWVGALNTAFWIDPKKKIIGIALTHLSPANNYQLSKDLRNIVYSSF